MIHVSLDLETLGTRPGSVILSIGACVFNATGAVPGTDFHAVIDRQTCTAVGLTEDMPTLEWWVKQLPEAKATLFQASDPRQSASLGEVLRDFTKYLRGLGDLSVICIWGNGAGFDNVLLAEAYRRAGLYVPWDHRNDRCYRTLKALRPGIALERVGTYHNALDDAKSQAAHAARILNEINEGGPW